MIGIEWIGANRYETREKVHLTEELPRPLSGAAPATAAFLATPLTKNWAVDSSPPPPQPSITSFLSDPLNAQIGFSCCRRRCGRRPPWLRSFHHQGGALAQGRDGTQAIADVGPCRRRRGHRSLWLRPPRLGDMLPHGRDGTWAGCCRHRTRRLAPPSLFLPSWSWSCPAAVATKGRCAVANPSPMPVS
jgi:hypothetical protein